MDGRSGVVGALDVMTGKEHKTVKSVLEKHQIKQKLVLTAAILAVASIGWIFRLPCVFIFFLHVPCPGCGMSRAMFSALQGNFSLAFSYHMMWWAVPIAYIYFLTDGRLLPFKILDKIVLWGIAAGFLLNWVVNLVLMSQNQLFWLT